MPIDKRSKKYLEAVKKNHGLISIDGLSERLLKEKADNYVGSWKVKKMEDNTWIAENGYRCGIDDVAIVDYIFDHEPTEEDVRTIRFVEIIESTLEKRPELAEFECCDCGQHKHWLDIQTHSGTLSEKFEHMLDKYCGC